MRHPRDPLGPYRAASVFGRLAAEGLVEMDEALAALAATTTPPGVDVAGRRTRLAHALADSRDDWRLARAAAGRAVRRALAPQLAVRAPRATLEHAAEAANGGVLAAAELRALVHAEVARALAGARWGRRA